MYLICDYNENEGWLIWCRPVDEESHKNKRKNGYENENN